MASSEHLASEVWLPTGKLKNEKTVAYLVHQASDTLERSENGLLEDFASRERAWQHDLDYPIDMRDTPEDTAEYIEECTDAYTRSPFFARLPRDDQMRAMRVLEGDDVRWRGGYSLDETGLWPERAHSIEVRGGILSKFVLSGLFGAELLGNRKLNRVASHFEEGLLKRAILVGSASLAADTGIVRMFNDVGGYTTINGPNAQTFTHIGGDMNGDFMSLRYSQLTGEVRDDATGYDHAFVPAYDLARINAYHSMEPHITEALLKYLVANKGVAPKQLHARLIPRILQQDTQVGHRFGAFGDFDMQDGFINALSIHNLVHKRRGAETPRKTLTSLVVMPESDRRLQLTAENGGVRFFMIDSDRQEAAYFIPDDEVEDYIVNLACATGGRVTPRAHLPIIDALSGRRPDNGVPINPNLPQ